MHSDCHTNEPGSIVWQSEHTLICSDGTLSHCPPLREVHPCASRTQTSSRIHQSCFSHPEHPTRKCFTQPWGSSHGASPNHGVLHTGSTFLGAPHTMFTGGPPMHATQDIS